MTSALIELASVRHQLDNLTSARCLDGLNMADERRYRQLCSEELALLRNR
jgi:hypothetical protein